NGRRSVRSRHSSWYQESAFSASVGFRPLPQTTPMTGSYDLIHVDDVASAFVQALDVESNGAEIVNLFGGERSSEEVVAAIRATVPEADITISGAPMPIAGPRPDETAARL